MKTSFLESGRVLAEIRHMLESEDISKMGFAVAYLSTEGYSCIEPWLTKFACKGGHVRFLVGLSNFHITESFALRKLLTLTRNPRSKRIEAKYTDPKEKEFHPKFILAKSDNRLKMAILGSSNLTGGRQERNVEANVLLRIEDSSDAEATNFEHDITNFFDNLWEKSKRLDPAKIEEYETDEKAIKEYRKSHSKVLQIPAGKGKSNSASLQKKFREAIEEDPNILGESSLNLSQICKRIRIMFPSCCDDSVICLIIKISQFNNRNGSTKLEMHWDT